MAMSQKGCCLKTAAMPRLMVANAPTTSRLMVANVPRTSRLMVANAPRTSRLMVANVPRTSRLMVANAPTTSRLMVAYVPRTSRLMVANAPRTSRLIRNASGTINKVENGACDHFCICGDDNDDNPDSDDKDADIESYHDKAFCGRGVDYALNDWYDETIVGATIEMGMYTATSPALWCVRSVKRG